MRRRSFLRQLAAGSMALPLAAGASPMRAYAHSLGESPMLRRSVQETDKVLVILRLEGGVDGLNAVVPHHNDEYYRLRSRGSGNQVSIAPESTLKLSTRDSLGFHPALKPIHELFEEKKVAIVQGVGYPNQSMSHYRSTDIWLSGSDSSIIDTSGWYGRFLEERFPDYPATLPRDPFAIEFGTHVSVSVIGRREEMGIAYSGIGYVPNEPPGGFSSLTRVGAEQQYLRDVMRQSHAFSNGLAAVHAREPKNRVAYPPDNRLSTELSAIARMVAAGCTTQLYLIYYGNFDTHFQQLGVEAHNHNYWATAVHAFQRDIEALGIADRITLMTISEFGRRVESLGSGTDHGGASCLWVIGDKVEGGFIGDDPDLSDLEPPGNLRMQYDFRQVYATMLGQWLGATGSEISGAALRGEFQQLPIFGSTVSLDEPIDFKVAQLGQNTPNPCHERTSIPISGVLPTDAVLSIHTLEGRLVSHQALSPGTATVEIDTRALPSGSYIYQLAAGGRRVSRQMVVRH